MSLGPRARSAPHALAAPSQTDTIAALASPEGRGVRAVARCSGPRALEVARAVFVPAGELPAGGFARVPGALALPGWPPVEASLWIFRAPRSYTGEDACELHVPASPPLVQALLRELERAGARAAQRGEFTRRAFVSGRLDLSQAEAVLALTRAEAEGEVRAAARALLGGLAAAIDRVKARVLHALAHVETAIDFPDEDLPGLDAAATIAGTAASAARDLASLERRSLGRSAPGPEPTVVLAGAANAGKSTLLNALAGREAALVSPVAGTTRDPVAATIELGGGVCARLVDTAGEKEAAGEIERVALERTRELARTADVLVWLVDLSRDDPVAARERLRTLEPRASVLVVGTKLDLAPGAGTASADILVSARTGEGLAELRARIARALDADAGVSTDLVQTDRQARHVRVAREALERAAALLDSDEPARFELAAVDLRASLDALGELTGALVTDDLLDKIFGEFCIGK